MTEEKSSAAGAAGAGSGGLWVGGAAVGLAVGAAVWFFALGPMDRPEVDAPVATVPVAAEVTAAAPVEPAVVGAAASAAAEPEVVAGNPVATADAPTDVAAAQSEPEPVSLAPAFDTVRAETDGTVLVAGRAAAGQQVVVMSDGAEVGRATADASGNFVTFLSMGPSAAARVLSLKGAGADGTMVASAESVILAPVVPPAAAVVASAEPMAAEPMTPVPTAEAAAAPDETAAAEVAAPATAAPAAATDAEAVAAQVPETAAVPEPLIVDAEGVRKLAPAAVAGVVVDTITYGALGQVQIAGRGAAGSFARLYLDNTGIVTAPVGGKGDWGVVLTDVAPGIYTLRVDQLDASGSVTSRFETPFQREAPEVVTAAADPAATVAADPVTVPAAEAGAAQAVTADSVAPAAADAPPAAVTRAAIVTVQPGFTLWQIARENYGDGALYVKVFEANKGQIRDPDLIYPGQIFAVPEGGN
jgi:LysM repeat protein